MRSYVYIRSEKGKQDVRTTVPADRASPVDAVVWCQEHGFKVIGHEIIETPDDENFVATVRVAVEPKSA